MDSFHPLYTIGHSNLELGTFLSILQEREISLLVDVRSRPRSFHHPQFTQPEFEQAVRQAGVNYLFLGEELGGRPEDPRAYRPNGVVDYRAWRRSRAIRDGFERLLQELSRRLSALLCAEEDPITCHRFLMICPELTLAGVEPLHLRKGGLVETQREAEDRLLEAHGFSDVTSASLFSDGRAAALEDAYADQAKKCAFRVDPLTVDVW